MNQSRLTVGERRPAQSIKYPSGMLVTRRHAPSGRRGDAGALVLVLVGHPGMLAGDDVFERKDDKRGLLPQLVRRRWLNLVVIPHRSVLLGFG